MESKKFFFSFAFQNCDIVMIEVVYLLFLLALYYVPLALFDKF